MATPLSRWFIAGLAALMGLTIILFMIYGHYTRRDRVGGELVPSTGLQNVTASAAGIVVAVHVKQGQRVHRGDPLVEISHDTDSAALGNTRALISTRLVAQQKALRSEIDTQAASVTQQRKQLTQELSLLAAQKKQISAQVDIQRRQVQNNQDLLGRIEPLERKGYVSDYQVLQQRNTLMAAQNQLKSLVRERIQVVQQIDDAQHKLAQLSLTLSTQRSSTRRQIDSVQQQLAQNEAQRAVMLRAQRDGVVSSLLVNAGQSISAGQPLLSVLPKGAVLQAQLLVPSSAVGFIDPGSRVVLRYQAYPYQKFGLHFGRVSAISRSALGPGDVVALTGQQSEQPLYEVTVALDRQSILAYGKPVPLKPGMALSADILLDRRSLLEWVFEPLYGLGQDLHDGSKT